MKKHKNFIIYTLIFVIVMILAVVGYNYLSKNYMPEELKSEEKTDSIQSGEGTNNQQNEGTTNSSQSTGETDTMPNGTTALKKATDFSVLNNNRRESKFI